jgi:hypothetical protein
VRGGLVIAGALAVVAGAGLGWAVRRQPARASLADEADGFAVTASGAGRLIQFQDTRVPLRAFRWLPPQPGGVLVAQVLGQNDRQRVAWFRDGVEQGLLLVLKPVGVADGFWNFAALDAAVPAPDGTLVLAYKAEPGTGADAPEGRNPLVLGLDPASQQVRWWYRGSFEHLALGAGPEPSLYLYAAKGPIARLALPKDPVQGPLAPVEKIDLPADLAQVDALLPTAPGRLLVAHPGGLAAWRRGSGWTTGTVVGERGLPCKDWKAALASAGAEAWWQPAPGTLVRVRPDGRAGAPWHARLPEDDPFAPDAQLLRLLGTAPDGSVWFDLATPAPANPAGPAAPAAEGAPGAEGWTPEGRTPEGRTPAAPAPPGANPDATAEEDGEPGGDGPGFDWAAYAARGLDRVYRWRPGAKELERVALAQAWPGLNPPAAVPAPGPGLRPAPAAGGLVAEGNRCAWWVPLAALPFHAAGERVSGN